MPRMSEAGCIRFQRSRCAQHGRAPATGAWRRRQGGLYRLPVEVAREKGVSAYVGDGSNRWSAAHRNDVAKVYRLALEKGTSGRAYHAVTDEAVPMRDLADLFARILKVETKSLTPDESGEHFGWMAMFAGLDMPASSAKTQAELGWTPKEIGVLEDIGRPGYFAG